MFQFPSNGKAYPKTNSLIFKNFISVSIPFKRESVSKGPDETEEEETDESFNSLQTGKRIQSSELNEVQRAAVDSFNSLQTGKRIQRFSQSVSQFLSHSCFNSLQTGKRIQRIIVVAGDNADAGFQFPSNGKAYPK